MNDNYDALWIEGNLAINDAGLQECKTCGAIVRWASMEIHDISHGLRRQ